ncbi:Vacuolar iron transporter cccA [Pseudocercospora fuligena]|uniref:Vacuolar iron transporter cccA n=1 Tax=Pseudocercospora fuligena TaxID=685502 RepID=A0A8H6RTT5_9PEZI|nr:Vacuolar iron transporter cccA [Pseudocercospora fuligena]
MALVSIKNFIFPTKRSGEYQRLLDTERGPRSTSVDSGISCLSFDDKDSRESRSLLKCRVNPRTISDATIGLSDGLTVPFALTAGLSALGTTDLVIYAGFAELIAGAISMGLGGYLGSKSEADAYFSALEETKKCVAEDQQKACEMVRTTFDKYAFTPETINCMTKNLSEDPEQFVDFLMRFHHQLAEDDFVASRAYVSGLTIALGYFLGGLLPLLPYLFFTQVQDALLCSVLVMGIALFVFGWAKTALLGETSWRICLSNAIQMLVLGGLAAAAAMGCVKAIGGG